jgi:serine/threonine-protein kinase
MGEPVGPQSDLYSLGIVLYEMLTGELPYDAETPIGIAMKHVNGPVLPPRDINPDVPRGMNAVTCRLLAKNPAERYADADELISDLEKILQGSAPSQGTTRILDRVAPHGDTKRGSTTPMETLPPPPLDYGGRRSRRKRRGAWIPILFLILLLGLIGGLAYAVVFSNGAAQAEPVPDLEDASSIDEAQGIASRSPGNFTVVEGERVDSEEPVGQVVSQDPAPDEEADESSEITLDISGRQIADLPDVRDETEEDARRLLEDAGFEVETRTEESGEQDEGRVVGQDPSGGEGETAEVGSSVTIEVGSGPATVPVPGLAGQTPEQAQAILEETGLRLGDQTEAANNDVPEGQIIEQQPAAGTDLRRDSEVSVTISTGPEPSTVPDVVGQTAAEAEATLWNALFASTVVTVQSNLPEGTVVSTDPPAGTEADWTAITVTVNISDGPPPAPAPEPAPPPPPEDDSNDNNADSNEPSSNNSANDNADNSGPSNNSGNNNNGDNNGDNNGNGGNGGNRRDN